jgi:hypothetical protein
MGFANAAQTISAELEAISIASVVVARTTGVLDGAPLQHTCVSRLIRSRP